MTFMQSSRRGDRGKPKISEEVEEDVSEGKIVLSDNEEIETFKRDVTSAGIESLEVDEDDSAVEQDLEIKHSLETLTQTLSILQEVPNMVLNTAQRNYLVPTMRATKRLLMTPRGCAALAGPITSLKSAIDAGILGVPKEPQFTQSLVEISMVISSFEGV
uniref:Holliday junction ATP-dependent DNA helicase RuvB n=1 Tax=Lygus hesperus TaxID=30085 RepID=A0A0A9YUE5_LYGHE